LNKQRGENRNTQREKELIQKKPKTKTQEMLKKRLKKV